MKNRLFIGVVLSCLSFFALTACGVEDQGVGKKVRLLGAGSIEFGQIVKGRYLGNQIDHIWLSRPAVIIGMEACLKEKLLIGLQIEGEYWYDTYPFKLVPNQALEPFKNRPNIILREAQGTYGFIDNDKTSLKLSMGVFPIKYNENARNLGEYLFRSKPYPNYIRTSFDFPVARLDGLNLYNSLLKGMLSQRLVLFSEMETQPLHDFSLSYLLGYNLKNILKIGAGVSFYKLFPVNEENEITPHNFENSYLHTGADSSAYYSFKGIMLDAHISFDIKRLFTTQIFGDNDLRLYAEAAVLGVKSMTNTEIDKESYYGNIMERIPVMVGFTVPTFKIFEVIAFELEYFRWRYPISPYRPTGQGNLPVPVVSYTDDTTFYDKDNLKWSVFIKYKVVDGWNIMVQIANDHSQHRTQTELHRDVEEILNQPKHWMWMTKVEYVF